MGVSSSAAPAAGAGIVVSNQPTAGLSSIGFQTVHSKALQVEVPMPVVLVVCVHYILIFHTCPIPIIVS